MNNSDEVMDWMVRAYASRRSSAKEYILATVLDIITIIAMAPYAIWLGLKRFMKGEIGR